MDAYAFGYRVQYGDLLAYVFVFGCGVSDGNSYIHNQPYGNAIGHPHIHGFDDTFPDAISNTFVYCSADGFGDTDGIVDAYADAVPHRYAFGYANKYPIPIGDLRQSGYPDGYRDAVDRGHGVSDA